jgi:hypothetical protein
MVLAGGVGERLYPLTKERATLGTAGSLAPEQIHCTVPPDQRADIYALGKSSR